MALALLVKNLCFFIGALGIFFVYVDGRVILILTHILPPGGVEEKETLSLSVGLLADRSQLKKQRF